MSISPRIKTNIFLSFLLLVAFLLRVYNIDKYALAGDEKYSLFVSNFTSYEGNNQKDSVRKPNGGVFTPQEFWSEKGISGFFDSIARVDTGNGALYTFGLHYWIKYFGNSDFSLRFPSLLFNLLLLLYLFKFVIKHFKDSNLAWIVLILGIISPFYISYAQVARNYSILYLVSLISTDHFLSYLNSKKTKYLFYYSFFVLASELCHISTFPLYIFHGLFVLLYYRKPKTIGALLLVMLIPLLGMVLWLISDGGKFMLEYVSNSVKVYNEMANSEPNEFLSKASPQNVSIQLQMVLSSVYISSEGLYLSTIGKLNYLITLFASIVVFIVFNLKNLSAFYKALLLAVNLLISFLLINHNFVYFILLGANFCLILYAAKEFILNSHPQNIKLLLIISIGSIFSLIVFAFIDGNTFRIMPRYIGYAYSYNLILIAYILKIAFKNLNKFQLVIFSSIGVIQILHLGKVNWDIYSDIPPRYFMSFVEPRISNPHKEIARNIISNYAKGDLVVYPSEHSESKTFKSVVDAQLVNFYLPKDSKIYQIIDFNESDKVFLLKNNGKKEELFDFEGKRYRY